MLIQYTSEAFPPGMNRTGAQLTTDWDELVWAALTVGRPSLVHVFQHGLASAYEAIFRVSMIFMALEERGLWRPRFHRTDAFNAMDPSEKGAINYFLGLVTCKLFAWKLLAAPWTLHLDVFKNQLFAQNLGKSRPDMVAESLLGQWHAFECKGRASSPSAAVKLAAKNQALRLVSVNNVACHYHIGAITYFSGNALQFYWRDPEATEKRLALPDPSPHWRHYYQPALSLVRARRTSSANSAYVEELDITIDFQPDIMAALEASDWNRARLEARDRKSVMDEDLYKPDGMKVTVGRKWSGREPMLF